MTEVELTWVTNHLGLTINVHRQWYCQEESTIERMKVAKVLTAKDDRVDFKNKKVDDLDERIEGK